MRSLLILVFVLIATHPVRAEVIDSTAGEALNRGRGNRPRLDRACSTVQQAGRFPSPA